jgi:hypothetical protein
MTEPKESPAAQAVGLEVTHDGEATGVPRERCCVCRNPTNYWYAPKDVALCVNCAKVAKASNLPTKEEWCAKEKALMPRRARLEPAPYPTPRTQAGQGAAQHPDALTIAYFDGVHVGKRMAALDTAPPVDAADTPAQPVDSAQEDRQVALQQPLNWRHSSGGYRLSDPVTGKEIDPWVTPIYAAPPAPGQQAVEPQEVVLWQYRWTNPGNDPHRSKEAMKWKPVDHPHWQPIEKRLEELHVANFNGTPCYEVRALVVATTPAPAPTQALEVWCGCGDQIMPNDGARCGVCVQLLETRRTAQADDARDAARYRWLRTYPNNINAAVYGPTGGLLRRDDYLDAAIDAALSAAAKGREGVKAQGESHG